MTKVVITGANGFIGKNLKSHFYFNKDVVLELIDRSDDKESIKDKLSGADIIYHLAGVNRPTEESAFHEDNFLFTRFVFELRQAEASPFTFIYTSSTQVDIQNPYGISKNKAEEFLQSNNRFAKIFIYRLPGVFGKWCRPNYNSVVATFCYNVSHNLPIQVHDHSYELTLVYIDDVINGFISHIDQTKTYPVAEYIEVLPKFNVTVGELAYKISSFALMRQNLFAPKVKDKLDKYLYSTYLSYLDMPDFSYDLRQNLDNRGSLFELIKSESFGQIFISTTYPGITRGNHFHHTKVEKFLVISGKGLVSFRHMITDEKVEYSVDGNSPRVIDIPPGYTHNIKNIGEENMVTLFWANEVFDPLMPDTYFVNV